MQYLTSENQMELLFRKYYLNETINQIEKQEIFQLMLLKNCLRSLKSENLERDMNKMKWIMNLTDEQLVFSKSKIDIESCPE